MMQDKDIQINVLLYSQLESKFGFCNPWIVRLTEDSIVIFNTCEIRVRFDLYSTVLVLIKYSVIERYACQKLTQKNNMV